MLVGLGLFAFTVSPLRANANLGNDPVAQLATWISAMFLLRMSLLQEKDTNYQTEDDDQGADQVWQQKRERLEDRAFWEDGWIILDRFYKGSA